MGNITVREIGLLTDDDVLIAIGGEFTNYKPPVSEAIEKMDFYINLPISSTQEITVAFSNDNIYATQDSLDIVANLEEINRLDLVEVKNTLPNKINYSDIVNNLTDISTNKPLSAMQGKVLKTLIDNINTLLLSDNTTLDSMQEVVDFIEANRQTLNTLSIPNIAGLENALNSKLDASNYTAVDVLAKVKSLDGHGSGLDADVVDGYEGAYLAGLNYGVVTADPNTALYPYILTRHANTPNPSSYWHIRTQFYSSIATDSNQAQIAIQYSGGSQVWARSKYGVTWTSWVRLDNDGITGAASTIVTSNLTASKAIISDANGKIGTIDTTATELGYVSGVTSSIQTQVGAKAPLNSPTFTGTPTASTAAAGTNTTQIATTAFVLANSIQAAQFTQSLSANGWTKLPNGLILQWVTATESTSATDYKAFPIAFPNACLSATLQINASTTGGLGLNLGTVISIIDRTKFIWTCGGTYGGGGVAYMIAIGF